MHGECNFELYGSLRAEGQLAESDIRIRKKTDVHILSGRASRGGSGL